LEVGEEMFAEIGDDILRNPGRQIAMAHGAESLENDQPQKHPDRPRHLFGIVLDRHDVPESAGQSDQGKIDGGNSGHKEAGKDQATQVRSYIWKESLEDQHECSDGHLDHEIATTHGSL
jgi:hypothetical protein